MGAWGTGPFDNDAASHWVLTLDGETDLKLVKKALADDNPEIVHAAASIIAGLTMRKARARLSEDATSFIAACLQMPEDDDVAAAAEAVEAVLTSYVAEVWRDAGKDGWRADTELLLKQLGGGAKTTEPAADPDEAWEKTLHRIHRMSVVFELGAPQIVVDNEIRLLSKWSAMLDESQQIVKLDLTDSGVSITCRNGRSLTVPKSDRASKEAAAAMRVALSL